MRSLTLGTPAKDITYDARTAVRCLIIKDGQICIIHVDKGELDDQISISHSSDLAILGNYYKLPGGGVDPEDSNDTTACQREALEETGCEVAVNPELVAQTTEYRGTLHQVSHAYICTVHKDTGKLDLTDLEMSEGLSHSWFAIEEALHKMRTIEPTSELGESIKKRDVFLLEAYLESQDHAQESS